MKRLYGTVPVSGNRRDVSFLVEFSNPGFGHQRRSDFSPASSLFTLLGSDGQNESQQTRGGAWREEEIEKVEDLDGRAERLIGRGSKTAEGSQTE